MDSSSKEMSDRIEIQFLELLFLSCFKILFGFIFSSFNNESHDQSTEINAPNNKFSVF